MKTCPVCGGAVFQPSEVVAYAGPICSCNLFRPLSPPSFSYETQLRMETLRLRVVELEYELNLVRGQRDSSNREIERLRDQLGLEPYKPCIITSYSSRGCSRGTRSCNETHEE